MANLWLDLFLSTPSARRATTRPPLLSTTRTYFLSTPSARRATADVIVEDPDIKISIHALREEGDAVLRQLLALLLAISIHALREEGDRSSSTSSSKHSQISIHALREEGDR